MHRNLVILHLFISLSCHAASTADTMKNLLPTNLSGWEQSGEDAFYSGEELFSYIDGGAEVFLSYSYKGALNRNYSRKGFANISVDIFDMGTAYDAFGVYSHTRERDDGIVGQGSQKFTGALIYWKNKYYVSITSSSNNTEVNTAILEIAQQIAVSIPSDGTLPDILGLLPRNGMAKDGYTWFHNYIWQNSYCFISNDNLLNINDSVEAVQAKYGPRDGRYFLFIAKYPTIKECLDATHDFANAFNTQVDDMILGEAIMSDDTKILFTYNKEYFISILSVRNLETGVELINDVVSGIDNSVKN